MRVLFAVLAFDFGEVPPVQSEEDEKTVNRPLDIARDMQKYKTIGSMARVEEILSKLEEASRILKDLGTYIDGGRLSHVFIHNNNRSQPHRRYGKRDYVKCDGNAR